MKTRFKYSILLLFCLFCTGNLRAQSQHWQCDPYAWQYDMTGYFTLTLNNEAVSNLVDYEIAAFCETECRGVITVQSAEKDGQTTTYGYLRIRSNQQSGETITFKAYNSISGKEYDVEDYSLIFQSQTVIGLPSTSVQLSILDDCNISVTSSDETKGMVEGNTTVKYGTEVTVTAAANEGYHFVSWTINEVQVSTDASYTFTANGDVSVVANFAPNQYTMTFVLDNGEENVTLTQDYAMELTAPSDPQKTGFTFKGWSPEVPATIPASDKNFTAQWERNSYKLTWDVDGVKTESMVLYQNPITKPVDPQKEGYTFAGWTPVVAETMPAENVTYTATWTINQYTMTFVLDNGEENVVVTQDYATELTAPADPQKTGFTFKGWSPEVPATIPASDKTFTAQWERNKYTVKFVVDGQTAKEEELLFEATITKPADPEKEGYTFTGWTPAVPEKMPAQDMTFTAEWTVNEYALIYIVNSQEWARDMVAYGETLQLRSYNAPNGYVFNGWIFTDGNDYQTMPAHDVTVTADITTGISSVVTDGKAFDVYDLKGRKVRTQATSLEGLPKGAYIINGRKVVK